MIIDKIEEFMFLFLDILFVLGLEVNVILFFVLLLIDEEVLVFIFCIVGGDKVGIIFFIFLGINLVVVRDGILVSILEKLEELLILLGFFFEGFVEKLFFGGFFLIRIWILVFKEFFIGWKRVVGGEFMVDNFGGVFFLGVGGDFFIGLL